MSQKHSEQYKIIGQAIKNIENNEDLHRSSWRTE